MHLKFPKLGVTKLMHSFSLLGFNCFADSNFYVFSQDKLLCLITLSVDDLLVVGSLAFKIEELRTDLKTTLLLRYGGLSITWWYLTQPT